MAKRRVVVRGGGKNLYQIVESRNEFVAQQVTVGLLGNSYETVGTAYTLEDALALIRSHSGRDIESLGAPT